MVYDRFKIEILVSKYFLVCLFSPHQVMGLTKIFDGALAPSSPISSAATDYISPDINRC